MIEIEYSIYLEMWDTEDDNIESTDFDDEGNMLDEPLFIVNGRRYAIASSRVDGMMVRYRLTLFSIAKEEKAVTHNWQEEGF